MVMRRPKGRPAANVLRAICGRSEYVRPVRRRRSGVYGIDREDHRATLRAAIGAALETQPAGALIALDLDRFRDLVIALSRQTADAVLVEVAIALRSRLRPGELLGRTGGDVFAVYVPGAERAAAFERARALIERFREPFGTGDRDGMELVRVTASVGVALLPGDASTVDELFARAETAVDLAKAAGRDQIAFYFRPGSTPLVPSP